MRRGVHTFFLSACLLMFSAGRQAAAQPPVPEKPVTRSPAAEQDEKAPAARSGDKVIYVPYQDLRGRFERPDTEILLPYEEYRQLLDARRSGQEKKSPPAVITRADYMVRVEGDFARIHARLTIQVLGDPWSEVPLRFGPAAVGGLNAPRQVLLRGLGEGAYALLFAEPGEHVVELQLAARIHQSPDGRDVAFECPPVAVTTLDVQVPRQDQAVELEPHVAVTPVAAEPADVTHLRASLGATPRIAIKWRPKASLKPEMNLLASVNNRALVTIADGLIHTDSWLTFDVLRGEMEQVRVALPKNARVLDVNAEGRIRSWKGEEQGNNQVLTVELLQPATQQFTLELHCERKLEDAEVNVVGMTAQGVAAGIHALDVLRESGQIAVRHAADLAVTVVQQQGLVRIESSEADPRLQGQNAFAYKYYSPQVELRLAVKTVQPRINVAEQAQLIFQEDELQLTQALQYTIERSGLFELVLQVPDGLVIDDVQSPLMREYHVDPQAKRLTVSLLDRRLGEVGLTIKGHLDLSSGGDAGLTLPLLEPLGVDRDTGSIFVFTKESVEVQAVQAGVVGAQPLPVSTAHAVGDALLSSAWSFFRRPVTIPVRTVRKPTRLTAQVGTIIDVQPELTQVKVLLDFLVEYAGMDTFRIAVPEAVSGRVRIELEPGDSDSAPIKQKTAAAPQDGRVIWTVTTQRQVLGRQRFVLGYDLPRPTAADGKAPDPLTLTLVRPLGLVNDQGETTTPLTQMQGEVVLKKERTLSVTAEVSGGAEPIDVRELQFLAPEGTLAYRYFRDEDPLPITLTVTSRRFEIQDVVSTIVSRGLVEVIVGEDQGATYRSRFLVKSSERQRLLAFLPVNLEILGAFLNNREVKLEKASLPQAEELGPQWTPFWINVARPESSEEPFLLTFQFLWDIKPPLSESRSARGSLELPLPVIGAAGSSVTQEMKVIIWVPRNYALVGDPKPFVLQKRPRPLEFLLGTPADHQVDQWEQWIAAQSPAAPGFAQFPTDDRVPYVYTHLGRAQRIDVHWWNQLAMTLLCSVTLAVMGWILIRTSWENKLGFLLLLAFAAALFGLRDSHMLSHGLYAARFGLAALLGMWLIHALFGWTRNNHQPGERSEITTPVPYAVIPPPGVFDRLQPEPSEPPK